MKRIQEQQGAFVPVLYMNNPGASQSGESVTNPKPEVSSQGSGTGNQKKRIYITQVPPGATTFG